MAFFPQLSTGLKHASREVGCVSESRCTDQLSSQVKPHRNLHHARIAIAGLRWPPRGISIHGREPFNSREHSGSYVGTPPPPPLPLLLAALQVNVTGGTTFPLTGGRCARKGKCTDCRYTVNALGRRRSVGIAALRRCLAAQRSAIGLCNGGASGSMGVPAAHRQNGEGEGRGTTSAV